MLYDWDEDKNCSNRAAHGVDLSIVVDFDWFSCRPLGVEYYEGEERFVVLGWISSTLYVLVYTDRDEQTRVISLRPANRQEQIRFHEGA